MEYNDGNIYEGYWANNLYHHQGIPKQIKGAKQSVNLRAKYSTLIFKNGNFYEGEFNQGKIEGQGAYKWQNGDNYSGNWKNGLKDGYGIWISSNQKESYVGMWVK